MQNEYNEAEVRRTISLIIGDGNLFECRIIYNHKKLQPVGYFRSADKLIECLNNISLNQSNVYFVPNEMVPDCEGREQFNQFVEGTNTTQDVDIAARHWILIDFDPERPTGTSATDEKVELAKKKMTQIYKYLQDQGFPEPICGFSGNGYHLLYRLRMKNDEENKQLLKKFLETLDALFTEGDVKIDKVNFNAARLCKLYGTVAQKGANTEKQPHRLSRIIYVPKEIVPVQKMYIEKVANSIQMEETRPSYYNGYNGKAFVIEDWLHEHNINYRLSTYGGGDKFILDCCPFNENHKGKDAVIFRRANGAIGFKCLHNSCSDKTWKDVRLLYEPDAYSKQWSDERQNSYKPNRKIRIPESKPIVEEKDKPIFLTARQILDKPHQEQTFIKTGVTIIDRRMRGLMKGQSSVWSGLRASAKSTLLSQIALNAIEADNTVIIYSGELSDKNFMRWMNQQAAGHHNEPSMYEGYFNTPIKIQNRIADWMGERLFLYDNGYGNDFEAVIAKIEEQIEKTKADFVVLDNLMAFNISSLGYTKWEAQSAFVWKLHEDARKYNVHIAFVAHPKKAAGFLRFDDISGTADIGNAVDDAFIVHRVNEDFKRLTRDMFKWKDDNEAYSGTNCVEIVKDRDGGNQDVFIPLFYEKISKRLKNTPQENVVYGWDNSEGFDDIPKADEVEGSTDTGVWSDVPDGDNPFT